MNSLVMVLRFSIFYYYKQGCGNPDLCLVGDMVFLLDINLEELLAW